LTFSSTVVEEIEHRRNGQTLCTIFASGYDDKGRDASDLAAENSDTFNIAMSHGEFDGGSFSGKHIAYWALGGRHKSTKLEKTGTIAVYPGTPQGRNVKEPGVHGFKFCRVDGNGKLRVQSIESDYVRFMPQKIAISENVTMTQLQDMLTERALKMISDCPDDLILTRWYFTTDGPFNPRIRKPEWAAEVLEWLRDEFGRGDKGLWSTEVKVEAPKNLPSEWYEEDTILGEFMRVVARYQSDDSLKLDVHRYMPQTFKGDSMASVGQVHRESRDAILRQTGMVGLEYLAAHKELAENEVDEFVSQPE
jgi:DNA repair exonuclease SbcCD nuclease subunit